MPNYSGVWTLSQQFQAVGQGNWPSPPIFRAVFAGGITNFNVIDYVDITTTGNAIDFGDMSVASSYNGAVGSTTRGVMSTGGFGNILNTLEFVTFATTGNAADFGDMTSALVGVSGCGSSTRGLFGMGSPSGSYGAEVNTIQYITIASTGNAIAFGELTIRRYFGSAMSSPTRAVWAGGNGSTSGAASRIDYVTIASTGNATTFGTLVQPGDGMSGCGSSTRGIIAGCNNQNNVIQYITIASTGNSLDFGDLMENLSQGFGVMSVSSEIRAVFGGGTGVNVISYVAIATTGNAVFFGDLTVARRFGAGCSNCAGGVQP